MRSVTEKVIALLSSRRFFIAVLVFFVLESAWIALSALYPQAFDENFHFGLIRVYSHYWLPFFSSQPPHADAYGAVARDPSYLYHYLMSFPYRFINLFTHSQTVQVILLRFIDIGLFAIGLVLFRRILLRVKVSPALANVSILLFVLIPIVPQLAAQVSYDDLLFPLVAWVCLQTFRVTDEIRRRKPSVKTLAVLIIVCLLGSLEKYAFLPFFFSVVVFLLALAYKTYRHDLRGLWRWLVKDFRRQSRTVRIVLPVLLIMSAGMFMQRAGVNFVRYHSAVPDCAKILSVKQCSAYSPWYYNYKNHQKVLSGAKTPHLGIVKYTGKWLYWMWYRLFFTVNGPTRHYANYPPLPIPSYTAAVVALIGALAILRWYRTLFRNPCLIFLLLMSGVYLVALFIKGFATYKHTAVLENMNGRYLIPVLLLMAAMAGRGLSLWLRNQQARAAKAFIAVVVLVLFLDGGGVFSFIVRSNKSWYWPDTTVVSVNNTARKIIKSVVVVGSNRR